MAGTSCTMDDRGKKFPITGLEFFKNNLYSPPPHVAAARCLSTIFIYCACPALVRSTSARYRERD